MEDFLKFLSVMSSGGSGPSEAFAKQRKEMQKEFEKMNSKLNEKMERMKRRMQKAENLPKDVTKFLAAARIGNRSKCSRLLAMGTDVNSRGATNETALCAAAASGHADILTLLLRYHADINATDEDGDTPLIYAIMADELAFIKALLNSCGDKIDINIRNKAGKTGIEIAFKSGNEKVLKLLSKMNATFECTEKHNKTLFKYAKEGKAYFIQFWFAQHPARETVVNMTWKSRTLALVAALNGNLDVIEVLYNNGANLDIPDEDGDTPLFCAAQNGFDEIIEFLVSKGCDANRRNKAGRTPVSSALVNGHFEIVRYLYDHGANLTVVDKENSSLLIMSVYSGLTESFNFMCRCLPEDSLQFNEVTADGETCLLAASQTSNIDIFKTIIEKNVDLNHRNKKGVSAALRAACNNQIEMVQLLLKHGAELDLPNNGNETAILCAAQNNNLSLLNLLIGTKKCKIEVQDFNGHTLVYHAVKNKNVEMLCLLIDSGAPLDMADICGNTPFLVAVNEDCVEAVHRLIETGKVNLNMRNTQGHTAVLLAVNNESEKMLKHLIGQNCEKDISDRSGDTPFLLAVKKKNYKLAKLLATGEGNECNANTADMHGISCLHAATSAKNPAFVTLLSGMGANLDRSDYESNTPFAKSAMEDSAYLTILAAKGSDVNRRNTKGQNAAHLCVSRSSSRINLVVLEAQGCSIDIEDSQGNAPIHIAATEGESLALEFLIEQGAAVDLPNKEGDTPVHLACNKGSSTALKCLVEHHATLKVKNNLKQTELMLASKSGNEEIIDTLLQHYTTEDIDLQDTNGKTALHYAIESKHDGAANQLIGAGADVNISANGDITPFLLAAKTSQWKVLSCALDKIDCDFLLKSQNEESVAHFAAPEADIETLKKLKEKLVSLTELTVEGESCLTLAASKGSFEVCQFLIAEGNSINHSNKKGENAICKAAQGNHSDLFFYLASCNGSDFLQKDKKGNSSLYYFLEGSETLDHSAISELLKEIDKQKLIDLNSQGFGLCHIAAKKDSAKLLRSLLDRGWDLNRTTASDETCITLAARASGSKALKFLLEISRRHDANQTEPSEQEIPSLQNKRKFELEKAFLIHAELGKIYVMDELLSSGIDVNAVDEEGNTALMIACQHKQQDFATSLLSKDVVPPIDVDQVNQKGLTALHFASKSQLTDCVEQLLSRGAKTNILSSEGYTCLHEAVRGPDSAEVAELLIDSGCDVNTQTSDGETSLLLALKNGSRYLTKLLIRKGAAVDADKLPLSLVVKKFLSRGRREIVTWLLELEPKVDVNKVDPDRRHVLFDVIDHGAEEILRLFISSGADIECEDKRGITPFLYAIGIGREDLARILIDSDCNTNKRSSNGFDCVVVAVVTRRLYTLKWLFKNVSGLSTRTQAEIKGQTALHICGQIGHPQMFKLLLANDYDMQKKCERGWTPIDYAIAEGHLVIVKEIDNHLFRSITGKYLNWTAESPSPICVAAANGYESVFRFLHSKGVNFENLNTVIPQACLNGQQHMVTFLHNIIGIDVAGYRDPEKGKTALQWAIYSGNLHLVRFLVEELKCDILFACLNGNTAIQGAVTTNQERILNYLISKGAPVDEPDAEGDTPLLKAAIRGHQRMLEILLDNKCNIERLNKQGRNAIHVAVIDEDNPEMLKFLMDKGVPLDGQDYKGNTACMIASYQGHLKAVNFLLELNQSLGTERNTDGSTPALLAAMQGKHEVLEILALNNCLAADDADKDGSTILMMAIQSGSVPTVRKLLEMGGCNLTAVNNNGIGVQTLAMKCRDEEMLQLLRAYDIQMELSEDATTENLQTNTVGHPIELLPYTPDRPATYTVRNEDEVNDLYDQLEQAASDIYDGASQRSRTTYRSTMHPVRHYPTPVSDGTSMHEQGHTNQAGSILSDLQPVSVAERASTIASAHISDIRHESQSTAS